jgi:calmodulin
VKQLSEWSSCILEDPKNANVPEALDSGKPSDKEATGAEFEALDSGKPSDKEATGAELAENLVKA